MAKNTCSRQFWKNFIGDENVFPDVSYQMPLKNFSPRFDFFFRKSWKRFHRVVRVPCILGKFSLNKKMCPLTCSIRCRWKKLVVIWNFFPKNRKNQKWRKNEKKSIFQEFFRKIYRDENVPPNKFYHMTLKKVSRHFEFFSKNREKLKMTKLEKNTSSRHLCGNLMEMKMFPQTCSIRCRWKNNLVIWNFFPKNRKN